MIIDRYYFNRLTKKEQLIYCDMYNGIRNFESKVLIVNSIVSISVFERIIEAITNDNPQLYYFDQRKIEVISNGSDFFVMLYYFFAYKECEILNKQIESAVNSIISNLNLSSVQDEYEKEKLIHDALSTQVEYDFESIDSIDVYRFAYAHSIVGVFITKKAVCDGIAKAVKLLLNTVNMNCIVVTGRSLLEKSNAHTWNIVRINGQAYHLDVTWDLTKFTRNSICYDYFNLSQYEIQKDHNDFQDIPLCTQTAENYFVKTGLDFVDKKSAMIYLDNLIKAGRKQIYFRLCSSSIKIQDIESELVQFGLENISTDGYNWTAKHSINKKQNTLKIVFNIRV